MKDIIESTEELKSLALWAKAEGIQKLSVGNIQMEFAPIAFLPLQDKYMQNIEKTLGQETDFNRDDDDNPFKRKPDVA